MGGMAVGAAAAGRFSERLVNPLLVYARVEAMIGLLALAFHSLFVALTDWSYAWLLPSLGNEALVLAGKLGASCLLILPQSVLLGMTFPLMSAGLARAASRSGRVDRHALFHQQPGRRGGRAGERIRADRPGPPAGHAARRRHPQFAHRRDRVAARAAGASRASEKQALRRGRGPGAACRGVFHRTCLVRLRDRLDPHAVARARRLDALV